MTVSTDLSESFFKDVVEEESKTPSIRLRRVDEGSPGRPVHDSVIFTRDLRGIIFLGWEE